MLPFVVRRLLIGIPLLIASSFLVFALVANAGTPQPIEDLMLRQPPASEEQIEAMERTLGLDKPWYERYGDWVYDLVVNRTFGVDYNGNAIGPQLQRSLMVTLRLVVAALIISVLLGLGVGVISALRQYSFFDYSTTFTAFVFFSLPVFWLAVLLKQFVAIPTNDFFGKSRHGPVLRDRAALDAGARGQLLRPPVRQHRAPAAARGDAHRDQLRRSTAGTPGRRCSTR